LFSLKISAHILTDYNLTVLKLNVIRTVHCFIITRHASRQLKKYSTIWLNNV